MELQVDINNRVDQLEEVMLQNMEVVNPDMAHTFYPGLYRREIKMGKGMLLTSRIHKTTHPFVVLTGSALVFGASEGKDQVITAPYIGSTFPGQRRVLYIYEDCLWQTFHPISYLTGEENDWDEDRKRELLDRIEAELLIPHVSSVSGNDLHLEYQKRVLDKGLKLTF